jgi:hypothetical protein
MHKSATKCNKTLGKWCKNKHGASKIMDTLETYQGDIDDTTRTAKTKMTTKKRGGSAKSRGGGGKSTDSRCFKAQRRAELETPSENTATINLPKSR